MGERPNKEYQIDRIDNNKGYYKENCRWVLSKENNRNKRNNIKLECRGKIVCIAEWAEYLEVPYSRIRARLRRGWDTERVLYPSSRKL